MDSFRRKEPEMTASRTLRPRSRRRRLRPFGERQDRHLPGTFCVPGCGAHAVDMSWSIHPEAPGRFPGWLHQLLLYVLAAGVYWVVGLLRDQRLLHSALGVAVDRGQFVSAGRYLAGPAVAHSSALLPGSRIRSARRVADRPGPAALLVQRHQRQTLVAQLLFVQNLTQTFGSYAPSWSITNEMFYYLFYGIVVAVALKRGMRPDLGRIARVHRDRTPRWI